MSVRITDKGSILQCVWVSVPGVLAYGLIDSGADITILGGDLFKRVATVAKLKKNCRPADKVPFTYDQRSFQLDGRMDTEIGLRKCDDNTCIHKMDAHDQLLLSKGVCEQLGIVKYHQNVERWRGGKERCIRQPSSTTETHAEGSSSPSTQPLSRQQQNAIVPLVPVNLLKSTHILPHRSKLVKVTVTGANRVESS